MANSRLRCLIAIHTLYERFTVNMQVVLANPRGFCAGVDRAIEIVERALQKYGG